MKIARFEHNGQIAFGIVDDASEASDDEPTELVKLFGDPIYTGFETTEERLRLDEVRLLAPVIPRSKVVGVGLNYADHIDEMGHGEAPAEPTIFLKPNTAVIGPGHPIVLPPQSTRVEHEAELAVVIGQVARNVPAVDADKVIFGYTIANDVTARDLQRADGQWARAKGFDSFCPLGPWIETEFEPASQVIGSRVNGDTRQVGNLEQMLHKVPELVEFISAAFTLLPGDVIITGTPSGVGPLVEGDEVVCAIEGIGALRNPVVTR